MKCSAPPDEPRFKGGAQSVPPLLFSPFRLPPNGYPAVLAGEGSFATRLLVVRFLDSGSDRSRLGVITSKRTFRRAVDRTRARRLMREAFRLVRPALAEHRDFVLIGRRGLCEASGQQAENDFRYACRKLKLLEQR